MRKMLHTEGCRSFWKIIIITTGNWHSSVLSNPEVKNPGRQVAWMTESCMVAPNICGSQVWNLLHDTHPSPGILSWPLHLENMCTPDLIKPDFCLPCHNCIHYHNQLCNITKNWCLSFAVLLVTYCTVC